MLAGPGVVCPLEGNVISRQVVVNASTAREHLRCAWTYDYTPNADTVPMFRAAALTSAAWSFYQTNPAAVTLLLNEPNNPGKDGDGADAATIARLLTGLERLTWCGPNVMANLESSRRWIRDYIAAGGPQPPLHGAHCYPTGANDLRTQFEAHRAFLASVGWHNPIVLTEVGPRPNSDADATGVLAAAFDLVREGALHGFAWFAHRYDEDAGKWSAGDLLREDGSLLPLGELFRALATGTKTPPVQMRPAAWFPIAAR